MATGAAETFACDACGKRFKWKQELAGKRMKCPCGAAIVVPAGRAVSLAAPAPADGQFQSFDDVFDQAVDAPPLPRPAAGGDVETAAPTNAASTSPRRASARSASDAAAVAERLGIALPTKKRLDTAADAKAGREEMEKLASGSFIRDVIAPIPIILGGIILSYMQAKHYSQTPADTELKAWTVVITRVALSVGLIVMAMYLLTQFMDVTFLGSFGKCVLRLCAIAIGPAAVYDTLVFTVGGDLAGPFAGVACSVACWGILYWALMRVDVKDATICVLVTFILVTFANYIAWRCEGLMRGSDI
jgi:hypothetical protein